MRAANEITPLDSRLTILQSAKYGRSGPTSHTLPRIRPGKIEIRSKREKLESSSRLIPKSLPTGTA
jgi:hypothetical protein